MQYMLLIYNEESALANMAPDKLGGVMAAYMAYKQELEKAGAFVGGGQLQPVATARTVSVRDGKPGVVDGPFSETKEALGGYHLIQCDSLHEAVAWAEKAPGAKYGRIEVRPLVQR